MPTFKNNMTQELSRAGRGTSEVRKSQEGEE